MVVGVSRSVLDELPDDMLASIVHWALDERLEFCLASQRIYRTARTLDIDTLLFAPLVEREHPGLREALRTFSPTHRHDLFDLAATWFACSRSARELLAKCRSASRRWATLQRRGLPLWARGMPHSVLLRKVVWDILVCDRDPRDAYGTFDDALDHYARFVKTSVRGAWRANLLESLCDTAHFPTNERTATFLLGAVRLVDSFPAYKLLLGPLRVYLMPDQVAALLEEAEATFDYMRAGPYH